MRTDIREGGMEHTVVAITVHFIWKVIGDVSLTAQAVEKLSPYITRYAQTMGVTVHAVGGTEDHLHVLFDLPVNRTLDTVHRELQKTTTRFLRETLTLFGFAWDEAAEMYSLSAADLEDCVLYIRDNATHHREGTTVPDWEGEEVEATSDEESLPDWLKNVSRHG